MHTNQSYQEVPEHHPRFTALSFSNAICASSRSKKLMPLRNLPLAPNQFFLTKEHVCTSPAPHRIGRESFSNTPRFTTRPILVDWKAPLLESTQALKANGLVEFPSSAETMILNRIGVDVGGRIHEQDQIIWIQSTPVGVLPTGLNKISHETPKAIGNELLSWMGAL